MSDYASELPKTVSSINGKHNAVTIEPGDNYVIVDNSKSGKIRLSVNQDKQTVNQNLPLILTNENGVTIMDTSPNHYGCVTLQWGYVGL
jgi:hypothetical protein